jgi:hypothetical protein
MIWFALAEGRKKKLSLEFKQCAQLCFFVGGKAKHPPKQNNEASKRQ